ncbi:pyridoxal phosphate-dependent transferase [Lyophyllum atratum]|nr:pyridoxal phosphate-dependent transferase [Lyophyllum atratum]
MDNLDPTELYKQPPPSLGHDVLKYFAFDPTYLNLNAGSYGATPLPVLAAINKLTLEIEGKPDLFHRLTYQPRLIDVRRRLAQLIGADVDEVVLVPNASMGINTIMRNFEWEKGDTIIGFNTTYGSVDKTLRNIGDVPPHPTIKQFIIQFPTTHSEIIRSFKEFLAAHPKAEGKKTVVVIDSIVSNPGVLLPWKELVAICKEAGAWSVVDGAHSVGQEVDINLSEAQPDFWVSNCHKWLSAKRAAAILYVPKRNQHIVKTSLPTSHTYISPADRNNPNFVIQYEWNGTIDYTPYLGVAYAIDFRNWLGGEHKINAYCHDLALKGGKRLAEILGTQVMDPDGELTLNMVNVELPLPGHIKPTEELDLKFKKKLLEQNNIYSAHYYHNDRWWTRVSAQIWVELEDFEKLGRVWLSICDEILQEFGLDKAS